VLVGVLLGYASHLLSSLFCLGMLVPSIAAATRRLHDTFGRSARRGLRRRRRHGEASASRSCSTRHITLPEPLLGRLSANSTMRGTL